MPASDIDRPVLLVAKHAHCHMWNEIKSVFPRVTLETVLHEKSKTLYNLFSAESHKITSELLDHLRCEYAQIFEIPESFFAEIKDILEVLIDEFNAKITLFHCSLLISGSVSSVKNCIQFLEQNCMAQENGLDRESSPLNVSKNDQIIGSLAEAQTKPQAPKVQENFNFDTSNSSNLDHQEKLGSNEGGNFDSPDCELQTSTESSISNCKETQQEIEIESEVPFVTSQTQLKNSLNSEKISNEILCADSSSENLVKPPVVEHIEMEKEKEKETNLKKNGQCSLPVTQTMSATNENESLEESGTSREKSRSVQKNNFSKLDKEKYVLSLKSSVKVEAQLVVGPRPTRWSTGVKKIERDESKLTDPIGKLSKIIFFSEIDKNSDSNSQNQQHSKLNFPSEFNKIVSAHSPFEDTTSSKTAKECRHLTTKKTVLCRYFFNASHCRRGKTCFFSHSVGKNIQYCSKFLQHNCNSSKCGKPHLQFEELDKKYKKYINDMKNSCPVCAKGSGAQTVVTSTPELLVQRKRPYSGGDLGEDLRKRLKDKKFVGSEEIKEDQPAHNTHISLEHDLRNQLQFRNQEFHSRPDQDLRHALKSKRSVLEQDLRQTLQCQKQESAHHGDEWNREEPQYQPEYIETVTAEQTDGIIERPYNSEYFKRENAFEYNETIDLERKDNLRHSERFFQPKNTAYEAEEMPLSSIQRKPGKLILFRY